MAGKKESRTDPPSDRSAKLREIAARARSGNERAPVETQRFSYTVEQRVEIATQLDRQDGDRSEIVDQIEVLVRELSHLQQYRRSHPVSPEQHDRFRKLGKPIDEILDVWQHPASEPLREACPGLIRELEIARKMVIADQRKGRGRPVDPWGQQLSAVIVRLAEIWRDVYGTWPARWHDPVASRETGRFYRFVTACFAPAAIEPTDRQFRNAIEIGQK